MPIRLSTNDLILSRRLWHLTFNQRSKRYVVVNACEERGLLVDKKTRVVDMKKTWRADTDDEMEAIKLSKRMALRRGLDTSQVPYILMKNMTLTVGDLYLSRRLWHLGLNKKTKRIDIVRACEERGILVDDTAGCIEMRRLHEEDTLDETMLLNVSRRMALRRGIDISNEPGFV